MKIPTVKHTLDPPVLGLEEQIPFKFDSTDEKTESERNTLSKYRQHAYGRVCTEGESYDSQVSYGNSW